MGKIFWWTENKMLYAMNVGEQYACAQQVYTSVIDLIRDGYTEVSYYTARQLGQPS